MTPDETKHATPLPPVGSEPARTYDAKAREMYGTGAVVNFDMPNHVPAEGASGASYPPAGGWVSVFRVCEHCNREYLVPLARVGSATPDLVHNFGDCPLCGHRDDVWIRVVHPPNAPDQARALPSPEAGCSASPWCDDLVSKGAVHDLISDMSLGYCTEGEHEVLERFADKLCSAVARMPNIPISVNQWATD